MLGCQRDAALLLPRFRATQRCRLREVPAFGATIRKAVLGQAVVCLTSLPAPWRWLWVSGEVQEQGERPTRVSVGTVGFNTRMSGTLGFPACVALDTQLNLESCRQ